MFHGHEYSRLWLTFDVDRTGFIRVDQVDPVLIVRIAVPIIAFRGTGNRTKGTDNRTKGADNRTKCSDNRTKVTGNRIKGTSNRTDYRTKGTDNRKAKGTDGFIPD